MSIPLEHFRTAARQLGEDATLRLREDGRGIAVSAWQRIQVSVCDVFRSEEHIAAKRAEALSAFLNAVEREQGRDMAAISDQLAVRSPAPTLTGHAVISTFSALKRQGGRHWLQNEQLIHRLAHRVPVPPTEDSLPSVVNPICTDLISEARTRGLSPENCQSLQGYLVTASARYDDHFTHPEFSLVIERALRDAARTRTNEGVFLRHIPEKEAIAIARAAVKATFTREINRALFAQFRDGHGETRALAETSKIPPCRDLADLLNAPHAKAILGNVKAISSPVPTGC